MEQTANLLPAFSQDFGSPLSIKTPCELPAEHIANLRIVADRRALLNVLSSHGVVAELGVNEGEFSEQILAENQPGKLHLIDTWGSPRFGAPQLRRVRARFRASLASERVVIHRGRSHDMLERFPDGTFDWVYIDTDHSHETTARELAVSRLKVAPGGFIAGHDYASGNITKNLAYGVIAAVNEFCVRHGWELAYLSNEPSRYLSYALKQMPRRRPPASNGNGRALHR